MEQAACASFFPLAALYREVGRRAAMVREERPSARTFPYRERYVQSVWFDPALRPPLLHTREGEEVRVEDPGVWNLEAGPDFLGAAVRVGPDQRRVAGDVEVHIHPQDWRRHGHARDPRYSRVRLHVTYFPGPLEDGELPPGALRISLRDDLAAQPGFSFEHIDIAAYPFAARGVTPPCQQLWRSWSAPEKQQVLDAAGQERLRRKAERMRQRFEIAGPEQVAYEELMAGLGYQHNKAPFRRLAELVPLEALRRQAGTPSATLALLAGVAGLLPDEADPAWDEETRILMRGLWDAWWKFRSSWFPRCLPRSAWQLRGRPANHPLRRLAAAARLFANGPETALFTPASLAASLAWLRGVSDPYWDFRCCWGGVRLKKPQALIGPDRAQALIVNVLIPFWAALDQRGTITPELLAALPRESGNQLIRQTALNLLGSHHPTSLYKTGLHQQGLLQIFHDYCLNDRSRCATCSFPELLAGWKKAAG